MSCLSRLQMLSSLYSNFILIGGLHLDGFADTCDGIFGGKDKRNRLRIMRDSSIGSFGVIGLICLIGIKYLCLNSICADKPVSIELFSFFSGSQIDSDSYMSCAVQKCIILFLMPVIGRWDANVRRVCFRICP